MKRAWIVLSLLVAAAAFVWSQRSNVTGPQAVAYEYRALLPQDLGKGVFQQVDLSQVQDMGNRGWELVDVTAFVLHNDERKTDDYQYIVTQAYMAYYFKRPRGVAGAARE
jgi:hypothetical protein